MVFVFLCLTSLSMIISRSIHVAANGVISFFFMAEYYSIVYMYHIFFIHLSVDGHLGCFHVFQPALLNCLLGLLWGQCQGDNVKTSRRQEHYERVKGRTPQNWYTYTCPSTHIHMYAHMHTHTHPRVHTHTLSHVCTHINVLYLPTLTHLYTHMHTHLNTLTLIYTLTSLIIHVHTDTYTHTHSPTHIHTLTNSCTLTINMHETHTHIHTCTLPPRFEYTHALISFFIIMEVWNGHLRWTLFCFPTATLSTVFRNQTSGRKVTCCHYLGPEQPTGQQAL